MIKTFIVDDEALAREELKRFLKEEKTFELIGEAQDGEAALSGIKQLKPSVVFLDIHIPMRNGLEVASMLSTFQSPPLIVFVTAYDQYAIQAFELNAIDYLLKPYDEGRFKKTCARIQTTLQDESAPKDRLKALKKYLDQERPFKVLGFKRNSRDRIFIHEGEVLYFVIHLTEVTAHMKNSDQLLVNATLKSLLEMLDPKKFQQTHRAYIVNLDQVEKVTPMFAGNFNLILKNVDHSAIPLSRRYAKKLKQFLKW